MTLFLSVTHPPLIVTAQPPICLANKFAKLSGRLSSYVGHSHYFGHQPGEWNSRLRAFGRASAFADLGFREIVR